MGIFKEYSVFRSLQYTGRDAGQRSAYSRRRTGWAFEDFFNFLLCLWHSEVQHIEQTLGAFAKLRKAAISFVVSVPVYVRLYVHRQQLGSNWTDFHEIWYFRIFRISAEKFRVCLTSVKNNRCFTRRPVYFYGNILIIKPMSCTNFSNLFLD